MADEVEGEGLHPGDFGEPLRDPAELDPRKRRRRRLIGAVVLMLLGSLLGAWLGWSSEEPVYQSKGLIYIAPSMPSPEDPAGIDVLPMFKGFLKYQVGLANSTRMTLLAMDTDDWRATGEPSGPEGLSAFQARRRVSSPAESQHMEFCFVDPDSEVALTGVRAMIAAYLKLSADLNDAHESVEYAREQTEVLTSRLEAGRDKFLTLTADFGGVDGLEIRHRAAIHQVLSVEELLEALRKAIANHGKTEDEESATLAELKAREEELVARLERLQGKARKLGRVRVDVERLQARNEQVQRRLEQMSALLNQLTAQLVGKGRIRVVDPGTMPTEYYRDDRSAARQTWAGIGALPGLIALLVTAWRGRRSKRQRSTA